MISYDDTWLDEGMDEYYLGMNQAIDDHNAGLIPIAERDRLVYKINHQLVAAKGERFKIARRAFIEWAESEGCYEGEWVAFEFQNQRTRYSTHFSNKVFGLYLKSGKKYSHREEEIWKRVLRMIVHKFGVDPKNVRFAPDHMQLFESVVLVRNLPTQTMMILKGAKQKPYDQVVYWGP